MYNTLPELRVRISLGLAQVPKSARKFSGFRRRNYEFLAIFTGARGVILCTKLCQISRATTLFDSRAARSREDVQAGKV
jgi:hypothetical protein